MPKIILIAVGLVNALLYNRFAYQDALTAEVKPPLSARVAGLLSIAFWTGVMVFSSMNIEGVPKFILTGGA
jgi:hypothetical protein